MKGFSWWRAPRVCRVAAALLGGALAGFHALAAAEDVCQTNGSAFDISTGVQSYAPRPNIDAAAAGQFVVVWVAVRGSGYGEQVRGRRFDAQGVPAGTDFQVVDTGGYHVHASVASNDDGSFVVAWNDYESATGFSYVRARHFSSAAEPQGFVLDLATLDDYVVEPSIDVDNAGNMVVVWPDYDFDANTKRIVGRRYDSAGTPNGTEFVIDANAESDAALPSVGVAKNGSFVVVWAKYDNGSEETAIVGQRFDASANEVGTSFIAASLSDEYPLPADVDLDDAGNFVVSWTEHGYSSSQIHAQRFNASAIPSGGVVDVAAASGDSPRSSVTLDADGNVVVVWNTGSGPTAIRGQRYECSAAAPPCSEPASGSSPGSVLASDCLFILKTAVGIQACEPECICDTNGDARVTASDALVCLNVAVGRPGVVLQCPC